MPLIVLDLDETLIHSLKDDEEGYTSDMDWIDMDKYFRVFFRPYYRVFLQFLVQNYDDIGVWSAGSKPYVQFVVKILEKAMKKKFKFVWTVDECKKSISKYDVTKALELLEGYPDVIMIDDNPEIKERYPKQTIRVRPYEEIDYDEELLRIIGKFKKNLIEGKSFSHSVSSSMSNDG
jgi:TFIIF-interacting CTD phosphatase-like protein